MAEVEYEVKYVDGAGGEEEEEELKWIKRAGKAKVTYTKGDTYEGGCWRRCLARTHYRV